MTFIAWLSSDEDGLTEWYYRTTDASDHILLSLGVWMARRSIIGAMYTASVTGK